MDELKFILFIEFVAIFIVASDHLIALFTRKKFDTKLYLIIPRGVFVACLLVVYIFAPILILLH